MESLFAGCEIPGPLWNLKKNGSRRGAQEDAFLRDKTATLTDVVAFVTDMAAS
jgi:hypothetical protein